MSSGARRYRVKSKFRFITFIAVIAIMFIAGIGMATGSNESTATTVDEYTTYTVCSGDTLWSIAEMYKDEGTDARQAIYVISQINDIKAGDLQPGMELMIPLNM